ncbi:MAG: o-succinylbenzoate synthase [Actinobacteria bacterium]|nr:o-succinylbenzoate synthase [Actinomycetota bacterium]
MRIDEIELRIVHLPYRSVFKTSFGAEAAKTAVIVTVRSEGVEGYGEGVMDALPHYREETIAGATGLMRDALAPDLFAHGCDHPNELLDRWAKWRGNPMAKTAIELAVWDCYARQQGVPMRTLLGGERTEVPVGASLGMNPVPETVASVEKHVAEGYRRVKLKIEPGWDIDMLTAVRERFPDIELTVDANSAYTLADVDLLRSFDAFHLHYIEQPLHWDDLTDHAKLAPLLQTPICLDETLTSPARVTAALDLQACKVVNVKVGRFGGITAVQRVHEICTTRGVPMWCGGMLESGIGRAHNIHLATMPGFVYPGDTASASRTYARDITEQQLEATNGIMPVPEGAGIGVTLDRPYLEEVTRSVEVLRP